MHEIEKTTNFRYQYNKLNLRFKRFVDEAIEIIKEYPTDYQGKIKHLSNKKDGRLYRFRIPGCYILYIVPEAEPDAPSAIILTSVKLLYSK